MNAFHLARPRGTNAPAKLPVQRKTAKPVTVKGTTRVLSINGRRMAKLEPDQSRSIQIESAAHAQASSDKRSKLIRGTV